MHSDFLDKFKGRANKVSKQGFVDFYQKQSGNNRNPVQSQRIEGKAGPTTKECKGNKKKQKISPSNKQNRRNKNISYSSSQLKNRKILAPDHHRKILTVKQNHNPLDKQVGQKKPTLKLPKIQRSNTQKQKPNYHSQSIRENRQNTCILDKNRKIITMEIKGQMYEKKDIFGSFLDEQATFQLKKINQFEHLVIQRKIQQSLINDELLNSQASHHPHRKGVTVYY